MDEIEDIVRRIGRQQGENAYYRSCYVLLKQLQDAVGQAAEDLLRLHQSGAFLSFDDFHPVSQIADDLRNSIHDLMCQERKAQLAWEEFR